MQKQKTSLLWIVLIFASLYMLIPRSVPKSEPVPIRVLEQLIAEGKIQELAFEPETLKVYVISRKGGPFGKPVEEYESRAVSSVQLDKIYNLADQKGIKCLVQNPPGQGTGALILSMVFNILPFLLIFWIFSSMARGQTGAAGMFGKSKAKLFKADDPSQKTTFKDVAGCEEAKEELQEVVAFLKNPGVFSLVPRIPKGVLLYGQPGTGKTLMARAVAGEAGTPFLYVKGSDFIEMFVGVGAARVRDLFEQGKKLAPCVIFIDEIDAIGKKRGMAIGGGHDEREQATNQMLAEMDGFVGNTGVIIIAATNRLDVLDPALVRPGRFDRQVHVLLPDTQGRLAILSVHAKKTQISEDVDLMAVAKSTIGMSGADLANVINEAALFAVRDGKKFVSNENLNQAVDKVFMGPEMKSRKITPEQKEITAYHEGGHALIAHLTPNSDPVHKITVIPRGRALGYMKQLPTEDRYNYSKKELLAEVAVLVAGRAAEEIKFGADAVTTGASNDFERATSIVKRMIYEFGMGESNLLVHKVGTDFFGQPTGINASDEVKGALDEEANKILTRIFNEVRTRLEEKKDKLEALVKELLEKETLDGKEVEAILGPRPAS